MYAHTDKALPIFLSCLVRRRNAMPRRGTLSGPNRKTIVEDDNPLFDKDTPHPAAYLEKICKAVIGDIALLYDNEGHLKERQSDALACMQTGI